MNPLLAKERITQSILERISTTTYNSTAVTAHLASKGTDVSWIVQTTSRKIWIADLWLPRTPSPQENVKKKPPNMLKTQRSMSYLVECQVFKGQDPHRTDNTHSGSSWKSWGSASSSYSAAASLPAKISSLGGTVTWNRTGREEAFQHWSPPTLWAGESPPLLKAALLWFNREVIHPGLSWKKPHQYHPITTLPVKLCISPLGSGSQWKDTISKHFMIWCLHWWQSFKLQGGKCNAVSRHWRTYEKCDLWKDKQEWKALEEAWACTAGGHNTLAVLLMLSGSPSSHSSSVTCVMFSTGLVRVRRTWLSWGDSGITV